MFAVNLGEGRQSVQIRLRLAHEVPHFPAAGYQCVSDERAVAPPRYRFGAHHSRGLQSAIGHQRFQGFPECLRLHVIGITSKTFVAPAGVDGISRGFP